MPGHSCSPIEKVRLDVLFGTPENFRREPIWFEVVDIQSPYHALLGRPALAKFMAVPPYAYLKMKMPGPRGVITIAGCHKGSLECALAGSKLAESLVITKEKREITRRIAMEQVNMPAPREPAGEPDMPAPREPVGEIVSSQPRTQKRSGCTSLSQTASPPSEPTSAANRKAS
jgi:hypothetical protein